MKKELICCHKLYFLIPISLQLDDITFDILNLNYLILSFIHSSFHPFIHSLKYLRYTTLGCNDKGIRKSEFVAKTQFLKVGKVCKLLNLEKECTIQSAKGQLYFSHFILQFWVFLKSGTKKCIDIYTYIYLQVYVRYSTYATYS